MTRLFNSTGLSVEEVVNLLNTYPEFMSGRPELRVYFEELVKGYSIAQVAEMHNENINRIRRIVTNAFWTLAFAMQDYERDDNALPLIRLNLRNPRIQFSFPERYYCAIRRTECDNLLEVQEGCSQNGKFLERVDRNGPFTASQVCKYCSAIFEREGKPCPYALKCQMPTVTGGQCTPKEQERTII